MTPSFSLDERMLLALAPDSVQTACARRGPGLSTALLADASGGALEAAGCPPKAALAWQAYRRTAEIAKTIDRCAQDGIRPLFPGDPEWPTRLAHLGRHGPRILFLRGAVPDVPWIATIGSRQPTPYGERATDELAHGLCRAPIGILSGLALGIDGRAHAAALAAGCPTLAVLGGGVDDAGIGPRRHYGLAKEILAAGGGLLSETPPGRAPGQGAFPLRNRLIAALCQALVVVEARERSGTLITARIALELGREVLAVPGSIFSDASIGTNRLIAAGARPCLRPDDVWSALALDPPTAVRETRETLRLTAEERALLMPLQAAPEGRSLDDLAEALGRPPTELIPGLGLLELQGIVRQSAAGVWSVCTPA